MDVYDFGKEKTFKYFSSPCAVFPVNLRMPHFCSAICGHISAHIWLQQPGCGIIRAVLAPFSRAALVWTQKWHPLPFCHNGFPEKAKTLKRGWDQRCLKCPISTACHPLMALDWDSSGGSNLLLHQQFPVQVCLGSPSDKTSAYGSNSEVLQGMVPGQHLQTLFCIIPGYKYYIVLPCQGIFTVLETGNKKIFCLLAGGFVHICSSLI